MADPILVRAELRRNERIDVEAGRHVFVFDQPEDNLGDDFGPTPPQAFVAALAACTAHYLRLACRRHNVCVDGLSVIATATPAGDSPARIGRIELVCNLPADVPPETRERLLRTARACYLGRTLEQPPAFEIRLDCAAANV